MNATNRYRRLSPPQIMVIGFLSLILIGALLLMLPFATKDRHHLSFVDALFEATSAVCVTGLAVVDTGTTFTLFGQIVLLTLIQIGGLGFMTIGVLIAIILGRNIGLKDRLLIQQTVNHLSIQGVVALVRNIVIITFIAEGIGALILGIHWSQEMGWAQGLYYGIFHSISAFNNAGFGLRPDSMMSWMADPVVIMTVSLLIILGGLGFFVIIEVTNLRAKKKLSLHTKVVLLMTILLLVISTAVIFFLERFNPDSLAGRPLGEQILASYFQGVVTRTAGFNSVDIASLSDPTHLFMMLMMYIGAAPSSTGGGIKVTTFAMLVLAALMVIRGQNQINFFKRRIAFDVVNKAVSIAMISVGIIFTGTFILSIFEPFPVKELMYETISAFATVGLSLGITFELTDISKVVLSIIMFIGRIGPLTMFFALSNQKTEQRVKYPEEKLLIG